MQTSWSEASVDMSRSEKKGYVLIAVVYLLGLFIGALDTGIVTPCRTVIQNDLGINDQLGVWIVTIYTLAYAASIPIMGKLADKHGRKVIYLVSVGLFGVGSLFCGLAQDVGSYQLLLVARAVQAFGGGGIMPVATAEFGTAFPPEKRGMALGLVGGVYGIANIFGASAGSLILDIFGQHNWQFVFYVNLPICLFIIVAGVLTLPNTREKTVKPIDGFGIFVLTAMVLSLLYGLKNLDFFDFSTSLASVDVYPFLIIFIVLLPVFILVEKRAVDPIITLSYFRNPSIVATMILSIITGVVMMGMIFIPQFAENAMRLKSGSGGYFVIILALFAGLGSPISGKLIDRFGVKWVLGIGLVASVGGSLYLALVACPHPSLFSVVLSLILIGIGMGFTMGTPLNYMMLQKTDEKDSNSALATLSLVRSIGTAVAPAIMVAFLAHAGGTVQDRIMEVLPTEVTTSPLPYSQELTDEFNKLKADENTKDLMADMDIPDLTSMQTVEVNMDESQSDGTYTISDDMQQRLKDSDVTTITENTKALTIEMFGQIKPDLEKDVQDGISKGIDGITTARADMDAELVDMQKSIDELGEGIAGISEGIAAQQTALSQMQQYLPTIQQVENYGSVLDFVPDSAKASMPSMVLDQLSAVRTADDLQAKINETSAAQAQLSEKIAGMQQGQAGINAGIAQMNAALEGMKNNPAAKPEDIAALEAKIAAAQAQADGLATGIAQMSAAVAAQGQAIAMMQEQLPTLQKLQNYSSVIDLMPDSAKASMPQTALDQLSGVRTSADLQAKMAELQSAMDTMAQSQADMVKAQEGIGEGMDAIKSAQAEMDTTLYRMGVLKDAVPTAFDEAESNYLTAIDERSDQIETVFQETLNEGFAQMFMLVAVCSGIGLIVLFFYRDDEKKNRVKGGGHSPSAGGHGHGHGRGHGHGANAA